MYHLRRSVQEPDWLEVICDNQVVHEVKVPFRIRFFPRSFASLAETLSWLEQIEYKLAKTKAYRLLALRSYPSAQLIAKLQQHRYSLPVAHKIVEELTALGYIQNDRYAVQLVEREFQRGYGPRWIEQKLKSKGLPPSWAREHIDDEMQREKIDELRRKWGSMPKPKLLRKFLSRGFDLHLANIA